MNIPPAVVLLLCVALTGAAAALAAFVWAVSAGQLDPTDSGAEVIFDSEEPIGTPTDHIFHPRSNSS
jgi:cbb3-type cytochrome oxidase maturation protein